MDDSNKPGSVELVAPVEQHCIIKFLLKEGVKPAEIFRRLSAQYGEETLSKSQVNEWCSKFKAGRESVLNFAHTPRRATAPNETIIRLVEQLILSNQRISVRDLSVETNISMGSVETIIHKHLHFQKITARWVPKMLTFNEKQCRENISSQHLQRFLPIT